MKLRLAICGLLVGAIGCDDSTGPSPTHLLTIVRAGVTPGIVVSSPGGINCGTDCTETYAQGASVTLTAVPAVGSSFTGWSGGGCTGTGACTVSMSAATTVTATFAIILQTLTVTTAGNGAGTVTSTPAGINCGADCTENFHQGIAVALTPTPAAGSAFSAWSGGGCSGTGACVVTMTTAHSVTATFNQVFVVTAARAGNGAGTVTSNPAGINCGTDCTEPFELNTTVTLTAVASTGSTFTGWLGGGCSGTGTCVVTVTAATTVTATFTLIPRTLTVVRAGNGLGTVTSNPAGINCGVDCTEDYNHGTAVTLTATPTAGSTFTGWSGGVCTGTGTCVVTLTAATTVTATFTLTTHILTVARNGTGTGTVTSNPAGINCGADCTEAYNFGTVVTLTAAPDGGMSFTGWSGGGCSGTGTCVVTISAATTVTATFDIIIGAARAVMRGADQRSVVYPGFTVRPEVR